MRQMCNQQIVNHDKEFAHKLKVIGLFLETDGDLNDMINDYLDGKPNEHIELIKNRKKA